MTVTFADAATPAISATASAARIDSRCRGWAIIVRANDDLPLPENIGGANSIRQPYIKQSGEDLSAELFPGDYLLKGEENHHRKARGWSYWLYAYATSGKAVSLAFGSDIKAEIKAAIQADKITAPACVLKGSGDVAAMVRRIHADRGGFRAYRAEQKALRDAEEATRQQTEAELQLAGRGLRHGRGRNLNRRRVI